MGSVARTIDKVIPEWQKKAMSKGFYGVAGEMFEDEVTKQSRGKSSLATPKDAMETGTLDDDEAKKIADSTAFRRNLFLSPMSFARKSLSTQTGRSVLNV